jgi:hypothetical protein
MRRKVKDSVNPSNWSNQPWSEVDHELQKAMYMAMEQLGMLRHLHIDRRHSPQIRADITALAQWIDFLINQREHMAIEIATLRPNVVKLEGRIVCERCRKGAKDNPKTSGREHSAPLPIWKTQLEFLLACTHRVGAELFEQGCASSILKNFPDCLAKLSNTLRRQRRYLSSMGSGEMRIEVDHCSDTCAECGQMIDPLPVAGL